MTDAEIITLNVGGVLYTTTRTTLTKYPDSMLGAMFNGSMNPNTLYKDGFIFIDRNGRMFKFVLEFLRSGKLSLPDGFTEKGSLLAECEFFQILPLITELQKSFGKQYCIDIMKIVSDTSECELVIEGPTTAISKIPGEYLDLETTVKFPEKKRKIEDTLERITLKCPCSSSTEKIGAVITTLERALRDSGWMESAYNPLPFFCHDKWYEEHKATVKERKTWFYFLTYNGPLSRAWCCMGTISAMTDLEIITLNVGGVLYTTTRTTLTKYPDSMLGAMFNGSMKPSTLYNDGLIFIDRDGQMFKFVLEFLRSGKLSLPDDFTEKDSFLAEAEFFQIQPLISKLHEAFSRNHFINIYKWGFNPCFIIINVPVAAISKIPAEYIDMETKVYMMNGKSTSTTIFTLRFQCSHDKIKRNPMYLSFERALVDNGWVKSDYTPLPYFPDNSWYKNQKEKNKIRERASWHHK